VMIHCPAPDCRGFVENTMACGILLPPHLPVVCTRSFRRATPAARRPSSPSA
jgi:hypothetical protein